MSGQKITRRYSNAFKLKVISEIESGKYTMHQAKQIYDIGGMGTIPYWLKKFGKNDLLNKVVRIQMKNEADKLKQLKQEKQQLESALAHAHVKIISLESLIECAEQEFSIDLKKNSGSKPLPAYFTRSKKSE